MKAEVFWGLVNKSSGCWLWTGRVSRCNPSAPPYGKYGGGVAHRVAYELVVGPIGEGLELDHMCRQTLCVNPAHLEPVTRLENMRRRYETYTHCKSGHEYTPSNTYIRSSGHRDCRTCIRDRVKRYRLRRMTPHTSRPPAPDAT